MVNEILDELTSNIGVRISIGISIFPFLRAMKFAIHIGGALLLPARVGADVSLMYQNNYC